MFPVLLQLGTVKIYSYGFFIALGYVSALALGRFLARSRGLDPAPFMDLGFIAIVSGVLGGRLLFVITEPGHFLDHPSEIFDFWNGGLVFYGGFVTATVVCLAYGRWKKMPLWLSTDIAAACVALAHGFGRIGCFAAGCCHGSYCPYPWAVHNVSEFVDPAVRGQPIHPVQLYESFSLFALALVLAWMVHKRKVAEGMTALTYLMGYAVIRFITEIFRGDSDRGFVLNGALSTSQAIAIALFLLGGGILIGRLRRKNL